MENLQCGTHRPIWMEVDNVYPQGGEDKDPARHNCSGKHSGFLALARFVGDPIEDYLKPDSKTQQLVREALVEYCEYDAQPLPCGIDGCSAPNYPLPLKNLALGFKKLANGEGKDEKTRSAMKRIKEADLRGVLGIGEGSYYSRPAVERTRRQLARVLPGEALSRRGRKRRRPGEELVGDDAEVGARVGREQLADSRGDRAGPGRAGHHPQLLPGAVGPDARHAVERRGVPGFRHVVRRRLPLHGDRRSERRQLRAHVGLKRLGRVDERHPHLKRQRPAGGVVGPERRPARSPQACP